MRAERAASACFGLAMLAAIALAVVYWEGGQPQAEGVLLAVVAGGIGTGIVLWAKNYMPGEDVEEERHSLESTEEEIEAFTKDFEAGGTNLKSRRLLLGSAVGQ